MIATILPSTPTFHAVAYNEKKVSEGGATLLEIKNFGSIDTLGYESPKELQEYLIKYSEANSRVKNPQFHLAISCKGDEWTHEELREFAHKYLDEMGYGNIQQPMLIYAHHDTDNNHIHIVTSRVAPDGKKICDSKERIRSQKVLEKLLNENIKDKAEKNIEDAKKYLFSDMRQFKSILEAMGYQCYETKGDDGDLCIKKSGMTQIKIPKEEIKNLIEKNTLRRESDPAERMKWRAILKKYRDMNSDSVSLCQDLRKNFGISLVWLGPKDAPWGYQLVDFKGKKVYDGYKILHINDLLNFMTKEEHIKEIENLIDKCLDENPYISTGELNKRLRRIGGYVKKDYFGFGNNRVPLEKSMVDTLNRNNKIAYRQSFAPASQREIEIICRFTNFDMPQLLKVVPPKNGWYKNKEVGELYRILLHKDPENKKRAFKDAGYRIISEGSDTFIINFSTKTILDMSKTGLPAALYADLVSPKSSQGQKKDHPSKNGRNIDNPLRGGYGSGAQNREWEVGRRGYDRDDPDNNYGLGY